MTYSFPETEKHTTSVVRGTTWAYAAVVIVVALALTYPCIRRGLPLGHSTITHILYQHYFNGQIAQGDWYPRWIIGMNRGLGGGVFFAQYPLPYYVPWGIGKIIPNHWGSYEETRTQGLALAFAAILAGLFTYAWCATFADRLTAMLAAIIYLTLPYFFTIDLYMRAAIGEIWALSFLPLSFYFIERMAAGSRRAMAGLGVAFALVIVSHLFTAVLLAPILLAYTLWRVASAQRVLSVCQVLAAFLLATGLAGVYTLPFLAQRRFFHPENFLLTQGGNASPLSQMFSFNASSFPNTLGRPGWLHLEIAARLIALATTGLIGVVLLRSSRKRPQWWHLILGGIAIAALLRAALAGYVLPTGEVSGALPLSQYLIEQRAEIFLYSFLTLEAALVCYWSIRNSRHKKLADFLMVLALASYVMMTNWSLMVWKSVHFLWNFQFPWRLNTFLLAATTGLAALAITGLRAMPRLRGLAGALVALGLWGVVALPAARMGNTFSAFHSKESYQFRDEMDSAREIYMQVDPRQALLVKPPDDEKVHVTVKRGSGIANITAVLPRSIQLEARCETDCTLQFGQFYYPAWRVQTDPAANVELYAGSAGGLMELSLPAGEFHLILELPHGMSERLGAWLSLACLFILMFFAIRGIPFVQLAPTVH